MVFASMCICMCVCVCSLGTLFKMLPILRDANIFLLIGSSTCYCIYSDNTERFISIFPPKGVHRHESHHYICKTLYSPTASTWPKSHQSALIWKLCKSFDGLLCFQQGLQCYFHITQHLMKQSPFQSHLEGVQPPGRAHGKISWPEVMET